ncbi:rhomboid family intramembrane serine protease [Tenacibaculum todarodis]|uniref:Rhomboid family intramembrane serine protease n=1 Tax=Tenacibaculum todarodis TaxID=1850252 RepID=A0A1L3JFP4_9FLAO|nr:rhomboid family intramembrane serine protease [Tenacibaculum todarodis]APG63883.1 rhomboid family intramembrane serine protease [Tenacibaculum todarodis]
MINDKELKFSKLTFLIPILSVVIIWFVYWVEINFNYNFNKFGVFPRTIKGLRGVFLSPFIHSNTSHLFNNSIPLFIFLTSLLFFYKKVALKVLAYGGFLTGFFTWIIARDSYHIGASGVVYLLFSFIFFSGILKRHLRLISLSLVVIFLYGSMIWYVLPIKDGMSWEGHLSGFFAGIIFAFLYKDKGIVKEEFQFTETEFDDMFDEEGNLILQEESYDVNHPEESDNVK